MATVAELDPDGVCRRVSTEWVPSATVEKVEPRAVAGVELSMERLGGLANGDAVREALGNLPGEYRRWIAEQRGTVLDTQPRREISTELLDSAEDSCRRIEDGISLLDDERVRMAFTLGNRAMARAARQRAAIQSGKAPSEVAPPQWRPFQIAFLLLNLRGIVQPHHPDRRTVDLLFFPTGGGKTEAYPGLAAFTLLYRRLAHPGLGSAGVSVLMRYTLRLLTFDQLGRAATLICALELERQGNRALLGEWPLEIGLWVGKAATPNRMGSKDHPDPDSARAKVDLFQRGKGPSPIPLETCPWCGTKFTQNSFQLLPNSNCPTDLRLLCANRECVWRGSPPLPILTVDEPLYRRLPAFLVATVDKFAQPTLGGGVGKTPGKGGPVRQGRLLRGRRGESHRNAPAGRGAASS